MMGRERRNVPIYILMIVIGVLPLLSVFLAGQIAQANGCRLHEGGVEPCVILGVDMGNVLHTMTVLGWLMLVTNFALIAGVAGLLWEMLRALALRLVRR